ncbi:unnamed protein product [Clonostachys rosea]|uniref:Short-chain dehydrogenase n=1 Tax=Bionectria ochroleuca TaxID=29856 RepID=A0ABY6U5W9_BIOOC|nr:unnamed protein product [Clonostachys rosea]
MIYTTYTQFFPPKPTFTEENLPSQKGKVFMVTGGNSGIGYELCKILYGSGATIYMATRSEKRATDAIQTITQSAPSAQGTLKFLHLDLDDLNSVKAAAAAFAAQESKLDVLWNNAGLSGFRFASDARTTQGFEPMMGMHCIATLLFTQLLKPRLQAAVKASPASPGSVRVIWTASISLDGSSPPNGIEFDLLETGGKDPTRNYGASKAGSWILAREMARRWEADGITVACLNPGNVKSNGYTGAPNRVMFFLKRLLSETKSGAYTELYAGLSPDVKNGDYVIPFGRIRTDKECPRQDIVKAITPEEEGGLGYCKKFWNWCEEQYKPFI